MRRIRVGDATQNGDFPLRKQRLQGTKIFRSHFIYTKNFQGGDATENRDFQREKQRLQGSKIFSDLILSKERIFRGAMRQKMAIFKGGNSVCRGYKML